MASQDRYERQAMRQRGVGKRSVANADFGFNFGLGGSRQDRQQMRQRGAGNRTINDVDFGFSFTPARSRRSNSRTSNPTQSMAQRRSRTPAPQTQGSSTQRSHRGTSQGSHHDQARQSHRETSIQSERHLGQSSGHKPVTAGGSGTNVPLSRPQPNINGPRRKTSSIFAIAEDTVEQGPDGEDLQADESGIESQLEESILERQDNDPGKENSAPGGTKLPTKRRKRKSIGQQSVRKTKKTSRDPLVSREMATMNQHPSPQAMDSEAENEDGIEDASPVRSEPEEERPEGQRRSPKKRVQRRRKRKSVVMARKKRRSSEGTVKRARTQNTAAKNPNLDDEEDAWDGEDEAKGPKTGQVRSSPRSRSSPIMRSIEVDDTSDDEFVDEDHSPEPPTPAPPKKTVKATKKRQAINTRRTKETRPGKSKSTFPILTHRVTNIDSIPTIMEEGESRVSDDADMEPAILPSVDRAGPNTVEVLAQICRETVETAMERIGNQSNGEPRALQQRKRSALQAFGADLDSRLLDMSAAVEDRVDLEARVRKSKREKTDLQGRWLEVRKEREQIALKSDRVRREHWAYENAREERWRVSEAARKAELELDRDADDEAEGLEFMLRSVAEEVTNTHGGGGLLQRLKAFNARLEKMVGISEGRAV